MLNLDFEKKTKLYVDFLGLFIIFWACNVSVAASGVNFDVGRLAVSSKGAWRGPGRPTIFFLKMFKPPCQGMFFDCLNKNDGKYQIVSAPLAPRFIASFYGTR